MSKDKMVLGRQIIYEKRQQAPSPSKDYYHLSVSGKHIVLTTWEIRRKKRHVGKSPTEKKITHDEFEHDHTMSATIRYVFGEDVLLRLQGLVFNDWLIRLPSNLLIKVLTYLDLEDIIRTSLVCRTLHALCNSNVLWKEIYLNHCHYCSMDMWRLGEESGWKRLFFTDKLQLQRQVSRLRRLTEEKERDIFLDG